MFSSILCVLLLSATHAQNSIQRTIDGFGSDPLMQNASISILVYDLNSKEVLGELAPDMSLPTASTMKLIATATALEVLGAGYQFATRVYYTGYIDSTGVLHGDLIVKGGGDPTLGSRYYKNLNRNPHFMEKWVEAVHEAGIRSINGRVIGDARVLSHNMLPAGWSWGDMGNYYGAGPSGLTVYDNMVEHYFSSGRNAGDPTNVDSIYPEIPEYSFLNRVQAANVSGDNAYLYGAPYQPDRFGEGQIPRSKNDFLVKGSMPDPAYTVAWEFDKRLFDSGIIATGKATTFRRIEMMGDTIPSDDEKIELAATYSPYLSSIAYWTNMLSVNLFAEHMVTAVGLRRGGVGSTYSGTEMITRFWQSKGLDMTGFYMNDGSGLSRSNAVSARHFVRILEYMNASSNADTFRSTLPVAGTSGTLTYWCRGSRAQGNLMAKSGSMTRVKSHAGYVKSMSGRSLAFAIIVNNYNATSAQLKVRIEKIMVAMANFNG